MSVERIGVDSWKNEAGHIYRYNLASNWIKDGERVFDVACGIGYGAEIIKKTVSINYIGADKTEPVQDFANLGKFYSGIDLDYWEPDFEWDVSVCFETLEHVANPKHLALQVAKAKRLIIVSVPTRPTVHLNPFHLHDFTVNDVLTLFKDHELLHVEDQPEELSHIFVFKGL